MTLKYSKQLKPLWSVLLLLLAFSGCKNSSKKNTFSYNKAGFWWQLLAFQNDKFIYNPNNIAWVNAVFKTQKDSVFYDSQYDLRDRFFIKTDSLLPNNFIKHVVSTSAEGDSLCLLIKPSDFFRQQFKKEVPFFCTKDSVVKIYLKIKGLLSPQEYNRMAKQITSAELTETERFFGSAKAFELARDPLGFYWVERPVENEMPFVKAGDVINIRYEGAFLNGRIIDTSPENFQVVYGTPDQLIKGLNIVISKLKIGQNSKIILPSHLAFGENGSSNGTIPPFTPMLYTISILDIKN